MTRIVVPDGGKVDRLTGRMMRDSVQRIGFHGTMEKLFEGVEAGK